MGILGDKVKAVPKLGKKLVGGVAKFGKKHGAAALRTGHLEGQEHRQGESSRPPITSPAPRPSAGRAARARRLAASRGPSGRSIGRVGLQYPSILAAGLCGGGLLGGALI